MALSMIESLFNQAKETSQEDIDRICSSILENLYVPEKSAECMNSLRHLYFILQASQTEPCLPRNMFATMVNMVSSMDKEKTRECLLCQQILSELMPRRLEDLGPDFYSSSGYQDPKSIANCLSLYIIQGDVKLCLSQVVPQAIRWMSSQKEDFQVQKLSFSFLLAVQILHNRLLQEENMKTINSAVCDWLMNASTYQLPNPYTKNPFKKDQGQIVLEIDGTPSRNFFTVLNIGQYYTEDQFLNIYSFSMLYKWIYHTCQTLGEHDKGDNSRCLRVFNALVNKSVDYCFRILDQCERKPKVASDGDLMNCCLLETVNILDIVCQIDQGQVPRVFQEIRRLYQRLSQDPDKVRLLLPILQFYVNHSKAVVHDPQEAYTLVFHKLLTQRYADPAFAFDTITFIQDNLEILCHHTNILNKYFPNILKILAWNPRTYVQDFADILPALMNSTTATEVLHMLLDLPCVTVSLVVTEKCKQIGDNLTVATDIEPPSSTDAFQNPLYRPMFNFFTRVEGGHGDTINRLSSFHGVLRDMSQHPRVIVCAQVVPILLRVWFEVILEDGSREFVSHLISVLLERSGILYDIPEFKVDVRRILAEGIMMLVKKYPTIIMDQSEEICDFLMSPRNIDGRVDFFANLVWIIGEYSTVTYDQRCTAEAIGRLFETLEPLTYELSGMILMSTNENTTGYAKILSMLMSTISKLATRCQDLIPRSILLLSKVAKQQQGGYLDTEVKDAVVGRAQELTNLLKLPNFASALLNPMVDVEAGRWHRDSASLPTVLRGIHQVVAEEP